MLAVDNDELMTVYVVVIRLVGYCSKKKAGDLHRPPLILTVGC